MMRNRSAHARIRRPRSVKAARKRRLLLEPLEQRLPLALTNAQLTLPQQTALEQGLQQLQSWAQQLDQHAEAAEALALVGQSTGQALDLDDVFLQGLVNPVLDFFQNNNPVNTDQLVSLLANLDQTVNPVGGLQLLAPSNVSGGLETDVNELQFHLGFAATRTLMADASLGSGDDEGDADELGVQFGGGTQIELQAGVDFDFAFGVDLDVLNNPPDPANPALDAFFLQVNNLDATASVDANLNAGGRFAFLAVSFNGNLDLNGMLDVTLNDPNPDGRITLRELTQTPLGTLVGVNASGNATGNLTVAAQGLGFNGDVGQLDFTTNGPFGEPELTFDSNLEGLLGFGNISSSSLVGVLGQFGSGLGDLNLTQVLDVALLLASQTPLGDFLDLPAPILDLLLGDGNLISVVTDAQTGFQRTVPNFDTAQGFVSTLEQVLGLNPGDLNANYDLNSNELTFDVLVDHPFYNDTLPIDFGFGLDPLVNISTSGSISADVAGSLGFRLGFDLAEQTAVLTANDDGPADGQIPADSTFQLSLGADGPVPVQLAQAATNDNSSLADLVVDLNAALTTAGLGESVAAGQVGDRVTLATAGFGVVSLLQLSAAAGDPILDQLHFSDGQLAVDTLLNHAFIENASIQAVAALNANAITATADFGFLEVGIQNGTADGQISIGMNLKDPVTGQAGGRIFLRDFLLRLTDAPVSGGGPAAVTTVVDGPNFSGALNVELPLIIDPPLTGSGAVDPNQQPKLVLDWPDITSPQTLNITIENEDQLPDFSSFTNTTIVDGLRQLVSFLGQFEGLGFLDEPLPVLNVSLGDIVDFAATVEQLVNDLENNPARVVQQAEELIEDAFNLGADDFSLSLQENDSILRFEFRIDEQVDAQLPINLDLGLVELPFGGNLIQLGGTGDVEFLGLVDFDLDFGIVLDTLEPFIYDSTQLALSGRVAGDNLGVSTSFLGLGVFIENGTVRIDGDGSTAAPDNDLVTLQATFTDHDADGKISLDDLINNLGTAASNVDLDLQGAVHVDLPVAFPDQHTPQGKITLEVRSLAELFDPSLHDPNDPPNVRASAPDFGRALDNVDLLQNLNGLAGLLDFVLARVQDGLNGEVFGLQLPLVGDDLKQAADFVGTIRPILRDLLEEKSEESQDTDPDEVRQAVFDAVGPGGLNLLAEKDGQPGITIDDILVTATEMDDGNGENGSGNGPDDVRFELRLERAASLVDAPVDFDIGVPALGLEVDGNVGVNVGFVWDAAFGLSRDKGFYLDTSRVNELLVDISAGIPDLTGTGRLGFLQINLQDEDADNDDTNDGQDADGDGVLPSSLNLGFQIDFRDPIEDPADPDDDHRLTFEDVEKLFNGTAGNLDLADIFDVTFAGTAEVNLDLEVEFGDDGRFPSIEAAMELDWCLANCDPNLPAVDVAFNNVGLNAGDLFGQFLQPIIVELQDLTNPLLPVVEFLQAPVPLLQDFGIQITPLELADQFGLLGDATDAVIAIVEFIDTLGEVPTVDDNVVLPLGSFDLVQTNQQNQQEPVDLQMLEDLQNVDPDPEPPAMDPADVLASQDQAAGDFLDQLRDGLGQLNLSLPILDDPVSVFRILLGQDVDLLLFDPPELSVRFPFPPIIVPVAPPLPLFASFGGFLEAAIDVALGFDTHGLRKFDETNDPVDVFAGLFISDTENPDGTGKDVPEASLRGGITAAVEVSLGVARAGVEGSLVSALNADLIDPNGDGKVHFDEFLQNIDLGLDCTFHLFGDVTAGLKAFFEIVPFFKEEFGIIEPPVTLVEFMLNRNEPCYPDRFDTGGSNNDTANTASDIGIGPGQHLDVLSIGGENDEDWFEFELLRSDSVEVDVRYRHAQGDVAVEVYQDQNNNLVLLGASSTDQDRELVTLDDLDPGKYLIKVFGLHDANDPNSRTKNTYTLFIEPAATSQTRVFYVAAASPERPKSFYAFEPGDDNHTGLSFQAPKATLQSVLDDYDLTGTDLVVIDTGVVSPAATVTPADQGATYAGSPHADGAAVGGITLNDADANTFARLFFVNGPVSLADAAGNLFDRVVVAASIPTITLVDSHDNLFRDIDMVPGIRGEISLAGSDDNLFDDVQVCQTEVRIVIDDSDRNIFDAVVAPAANCDPNILPGGGEGSVSTSVRILGDGVDDAQLNVVRNSNFVSTGDGARIESHQPNTLHNNSFAGSNSMTTGVFLYADTPAAVFENNISGFDTGLYSDSPLADVYANRVHDNAVGMSSRRGVLGPNNPAPQGSPGGMPPNEVFQNVVGVRVPIDSSGVAVRFNDIHGNDVGVEAHGDRQQIVANLIHDNVVGVKASRMVGPADWEGQMANLIHGNQTGVKALPGAEVKYNRIFDNDTGLHAVGREYVSPIHIIDGRDRIDVHHNLFYRNHDRSLLIDRAGNVRAHNNTHYEPQADGVYLMGRIDEVDIRNNIIQVDQATALFVTPEAQFGYTSDYNNLFATGSGKVAFQGKEFFDLYDWQVEAASDVRSIGLTLPDPILDAPLFVDPANDDFHLQPGSTSIAAGDPASPLGDEPEPNGNRINLGAFGGTPGATVSQDAFLRLNAPNLYVDLVPGNQYEVVWETFNVPDELVVRLVEVDPQTGQRLGTTDVATSVPAADGMITWTPGDFVAGDTNKRYLIQLSTVNGAGLTAESREPFSIPDVELLLPNTFYVDDNTNDNDQYTPQATGNNRNTGTTPADPKLVIRPLVLSYETGQGDVIRVDTGSYVHAVNLNLSCDPLPQDPRMNTVCDTSIEGPTAPAFPDPPGALIDRANDTLERSTAIDLINADAVTVQNVSFTGAGIGQRVRQGSENFSASHVEWNGNRWDGLRVEGNSHGADLDSCTSLDNGRYGVYVDSRLDVIQQCVSQENTEIGIAGRNVGGAILHNNHVSGSQIGIDIINPGSHPRALIGNEDLDASNGNIVHDNTDTNVFASGNVLVAGNHVSQGGKGIRLEDGADARRNVVHNHSAEGIDAMGSSSNIDENRVFQNNIGIVASYDSAVERNVVYSHAMYGIHGYHLGGPVAHNTVDQTGDTSVRIDGPAVAPELMHNTIYETCSDNTAPPLPPAPAGATVVELPWDWVVSVFPNSPSIAPFTAQLWGRAQIEYTLSQGPAFDLGPGGGPDALTDEPVPPFNPTDGFSVIDFELLALRLDGMRPINNVGRINVTMDSLPSTGSYGVGNFGGFLTVTGSFNFFLDLELPDLGIRTTTSPSAPLSGVIFGGSSPLNEFDALQAPFDLFFDAPATLLDEQGAPFGTLSGFLTEVSDEPQDAGATCADLAIHITNDVRYATLSGNAVYVEGNAETGGGSDIQVDPDSTMEFRSNHNAWMHTWGQLGSFDAVPLEDLPSWQAATRQDGHSIEPISADGYWADPDGDDNRLGGDNGDDDNFHLFSTFGHAAHGSQAPVISPATGLPEFIPFDPLTDFVSPPIPGAVSPGVDAGDRALGFGNETDENGMVINQGAFGNTEQASKSRAEYVNLVYPLGNEQLVPGRTYEIPWRTNLAAPTVEVELFHRKPGPGATLEQTIAAAAPNTGQFDWTVPGNVPLGDDYCVGVTIPGSSGDVTGACIDLLAVQDDSRPPIVEIIMPLFVEHEQSTGGDVSSVEVTVSENLDPVVAADPNNYQLCEPGPNGVFDAPQACTSDDVLHSLAPAYTPGATAEQPSTVEMNFVAGVLPAGEYRLVLLDSLIDLAGLSFDGDNDGIAGVNYVRDFTIDKTPPTVLIEQVPDPTNQTPDQIGILFDEPVKCFGLSDLQLTRDGGGNLLTGAQSLTTLDHMLWNLTNLSPLTAEEGTYELELQAAGSGICDLAENPLQTDADMIWFLDNTPPTGGGEVLPDPRNTEVVELFLGFNEPVTNFDAGDITVSPPLPITGFSSADGLNWRVAFAPGANDGVYHFSVPAGSVQDEAGSVNVDAMDLVWFLDSSPPVAEIEPVAPDPSNVQIRNVRVRFNQPVKGVDISDFELTRDLGPNLLDGTESLTTMDGREWLLEFDAAVDDGDYEIKLKAAGSGVADGAGNVLAQDATVGWTQDSEPPFGHIEGVVELVNLPPTNFVVFHEAVIIGFEDAVPSLTRDSVDVPVEASFQMLTPTTHEMILNALEPLQEGNYIVTIPTLGIRDRAGNPLREPITATWTLDQTSPTVVITPVVEDPRIDRVPEIQFVFSEPVRFFDPGDVVLEHDGQPVPLNGSATLTTQDNQIWTLGNLEALTAATGEYEVRLSASRSGITDLAGNPLRVGTFDVWQVVDTPVNQLVLRQEGSNMVLRRNSVVVATFPIADGGTIEIMGQDGVDDVLTIDLSSGEPLPVNIEFDGGAGGQDAIQLLRGAVTETNYSFDNQNDGSIEVDGKQITYIGLEPIVDELTVAQRSFTFSGSDDQITLGPSALGLQGFLRIASQGTSEVVDFAVFGQPPTIAAGPGDDTVTVDTGIMPRVDGGPGRDALAFTGRNLDLDLTAVADGGLAGLEEIDISGSGANTLSVAAQEVLDISDTTDTLTVRSNADDQVDLDESWVFAGTEVVDNEFFRLFRQGDANLRLSGPRNWQNPVDGLDVNGNTFVVSFDILFIINLLNSPNPSVIDATGRLQDAAQAAAVDFLFYDVDGNGFATHFDALHVLNFLNAQSNPEGEENVTRRSDLLTAPHAQLAPTGSVRLSRSLSLIPWPRGLLPARPLPLNGRVDRSSGPADSPGSHPAPPPPAAPTTYHAARQALRSLSASVVDSSELEDALATIAADIAHHWREGL